MGLREKLYWRRGEVREYLGLSEQMMTKLVRAGTLVAKRFPGMGWAFFEREEVLRLKPVPQASVQCSVASVQCPVSSIQKGKVEPRNTGKGK